MEIKKYQCDICTWQLPSTKNYKPTTMQVIFETEQDEGRLTKRYFDIVQIDICQNCIDIALTGKYIHATGAMGYNNYYFKKD